jgi:hypothetical protein
MKTRRLTIPEILLIGGTRVALGAGIGFLLSGRLNRGQRKAAGWALFAVGALSSIPILVGVLGKPSLREELVESAV